MEKKMERTGKEENKKSKVNRMMSYIIIVVSVIMLLFCVTQIVKYVIYTNENATLTKNLETLKQDSNYIRDYFEVLNNDEYYSVYIDDDYQYVDSVNDSVAIIK